MAAAFGIQSSRKKPLERCSRCLMRQEMCLCALIPRLETTTKLVLVMHRREVAKPTNTGRLAALALSQSVTLVRGDRQDPSQEYDFYEGGRQPLLLFPSAKAEVLSRQFLAQFTGPFTLVVPDGSWRQASKVGTRVAALQDVPHVTLPAGLPTAYHLRRETKNEGLATIEGIARAFGIIESPAIQQALEEVFQAMVARTLKTRGHISE